jgi:hypothetical protein
LGRIDQQESPLTGRQAARDLIGEVDVPGRIDQMQGVGLPVLRLIPDRHCVGLDRNATFTLKIHRIQNLFFGLAGGDSARGFEKPVSEGRFAVIDMGDNGKVAYQALQILAHFSTKSVHYISRLQGCQRNHPLV